MRRNSLLVAVLLALAMSLCDCAGSGIPDAKPTAQHSPAVGEHPDKTETVRGDDDPSVVTLDLGSALHEHRLSAGDQLPGNIIIPTTNLNATPITVALQAVLTGTDVSLSWDTGQLGDRLVTVMNLSGPLPKVVEKICSAAKVFCSFRHGSVELSEHETFVVAMPPVAKVVASGSGSNASSGGGGSNSMIDAIGQLIGSKPQVDDQGGNLIYTTDVIGEERVSRYLEQLRNGRPLVVLQLYVWEVTLDKENAEGINWNQLKMEGIGPGWAKLALDASSQLTSPANTPGGISLGAVTTGRLNTTSLLGFLSTQGRVQTISNPQVTFVSGSGAELKIGGKQRYISEVGQLVAANNTSGTTNPNSTTGVGTNTVNTDSIDTGLTITVNGSYENGVVFANLDLNLINLVSLNPTASGGGTIDLPQTTDEKISTVIRVRPGDNLVMAGLVTSKDDNSRQGLPLPGDNRLPMYGDDQAENHELVVVVKPSVVLFSDKDEVVATKKKEDSRPLPDAVMIDKDGSKKIKQLPQQSEAQPAPEPVALGPKPPPELMVSVPNPQPTTPIPVDPSPDAAPVDRRMMQRGFSHAFDSLLQPAPSSVTASGEDKP